MADTPGHTLKQGNTTLSLTLVAALLMCTMPGKAFALSELKPAETAEPAPQNQTDAPPPPPEAPPQDLLTTPDIALPPADPVVRDTPVEREALPSVDTHTESSAAKNKDQGISVEVLFDISQIPQPAQRMRELIIEAARTGDPEKLRPLLGTGPTATQLALGTIETDPIDYIRSISGDGEGLEILAILIDLLNVGFAHIDAGQPEDTYIWPYFAAVPLDALTPPQKVELLRLVTAGDLQDMAAYGSYNFFRIGISPDGAWRFFIAGE